MAAEGDVDRIVREIFFPRLRNGILVEVGAARPDFLSIGASFRSLGWKVIAVEPNPVFCAAHRALGYSVLEYACSDEDADKVDFFVVDMQGHTYLNGAVSFESFSSLGIKGHFATLYDKVRGKAKKKTIPVKVRMLDTILAEHEPGLIGIDILAIDVEGWELSVMRGLSLTKYSPRVVILENLFKELAYKRFMQSRGYVRWRRIEPNDVYLHPSMDPQQSN
jgi:FkbM family methyltransferase